MRVDLMVPRSQYWLAKAAWANWDPVRKVWYVEDRENLTPYLRWMPAHLRAPFRSTDDVVAAGQEPQATSPEQQAPREVGWQDRIVKWRDAVDAEKGFRIWTDGACSPNPGLGGWGWHRCDGQSEFGGERETTNNRMEMMAILMALRSLRDGEAAVIYSDSQYCVNGLTVWHRKWIRNKWKKNGQPMPNRDLWLALHEERCRLPVQFRWVRGHAGDPGNERADKLANEGRASILK